MELKELFLPDVVGNDDAVVKRLQNSPFPVVMYGAAADVGGQIAKKLAANGLHVANIVTDRDCPPVNTASPALNGIETCTAAEADRKYAAYHVIAGFVGCYENTAAIAEKLHNARSVDYLSEIFDMEPVRPEYVIENMKWFKAFHESLSDQRSKDSFVAYLLAKVRQDMKYIPPYFDKIQYFPSDVIRLSGDERYFDCGAFTGDTIADFLKTTGGNYRQIWAAEPDPDNFRKLQQFVHEQHLHDVMTVNRGIYAFSGRQPFRAEGSMLSMIADDAPQFIEVDKVDNIVDNTPVTYLKMDVEGAELMALQGAERTILTGRPKLGISIYHRERDLMDIPTYIRSLVPEYRFYFRVHKKLAIDTVLYAIAPSEEHG